MDPNESMFDDINDILGDEDTPANGEPAAEPQAPRKKVDEERYKNLQELARQQAEKSKDLEKKLSEQQEFIDRITGNSKVDESLVQEANERKSWEEDAPNKAKELVNQTKEEIMEEVKRLRQEVALKDVYKNVQKKYDVDLNTVSPDLINAINMFSPDARAKDPEGVLVNALKIVGELKERDPSMPYVEDGLGNNPRTPAAASDKEAEAIRARLFGSNGSKARTKTIFET